LKRILSGSAHWIAPILLSVPLITWLTFMGMKVRIPGLEGRVIAALLISLYIIGALLEIRWLLVVRLAWNLITRRSSTIDLRDLMFSLTAIALYPVLIGSLMALSRSNDGKVKLRDAILTVVTLGLWLSYVQGKIAKSLCRLFDELKFFEETPKPFTI
jgi:hypothetical protein